MNDRSGSCSSVARIAARVLALGVGGAIMAAGCGVESSPTGAATDQLGARGVLRFHLDPSRAVGEGRNDFSLVVEDGASQPPAAGAVVSAKALMPAMGHTSEPDVTATAPGDYAIDGVLFDMPGSWAVRLRVEDATDHSLVDEAEFTFDVP